jgi:apolipoprotein N-acyltransferase
MSSPLPLMSFPLRIAAEHVLGLIIRDGHDYYNAAGHVNAGGELVATHGKRTLVPVAERSFWGFEALGERAFTVGRTAPLLEVGNRRVIPIICYEVFDRNAIADGIGEGGDLIAILSSDRPFAGKRVAYEQSLGAAILRAAEFRLPVVRASLGGISALIAANGELLASSQPGETGVLFLENESH